MKRRKNCGVDSNGIYLHEFTNNEREISIPHEALQLPLSGILNVLVFEFAVLFLSVYVRPPAKVCEVCPRKQKILGTSLKWVGTRVS